MLPCQFEWLPGLKIAPDVLLRDPADARPARNSHERWQPRDDEDCCKRSPRRLREWLAADDRGRLSCGNGAPPEHEQLWLAMESVRRIERFSLPILPWTRCTV